MRLMPTPRTNLRAGYCFLHLVPQRGCHGKIHPCPSCDGRGIWRSCREHPERIACACEGAAVEFCPRCRGRRGVVECSRCSGHGSDNGPPTPDGIENTCARCGGQGTLPADWCGGVLQPK